MKTKLTLLLAFIAGLTGGLASRCFESGPAHAQTAAAPPEIRAQKFVLVDESGVARGVFGIEKNGAPELEIMDRKGRIFACEFRGWSSIHGTLRETASEGPKKPALLPINP